MKKSTTIGIIVCRRGAGRIDRSDLADFGLSVNIDPANLVPKTPTLAISCAIGDHEDCPGGSGGCECGCHKRQPCP
jgi:hypothetical protein